MRRGALKTLNEGERIFHFLKWKRRQASVSLRWVSKVKTTGRFVYNINNLRRENNLKREFLFLLEPFPLLDCFYTETVCLA